MEISKWNNLENCFRNCNFPKVDFKINTDDSDNDKELSRLFDKSGDCSFDEFIDFDKTVPTYEEVDVIQVDWRETLCKECADEVIDSNKCKNFLESSNKNVISVTPTKYVTVAKVLNLVLNYLQKMATKKSASSNCKIDWNRVVNETKWASSEDYQRLF